MPGRIDFAPKTSPLARPKAITAVFRRTTPQGTPGKYVLLPNVIAEQIQERAGASPAVALLRYTADQYTAAGADYPVRIDDSIPLNATNPYVVKSDDWIVVATFDPLGNTRFLFSGFAKIPEGQLGPSTERVSFQAISSVEREWDRPLGYGTISGTNSWGDVDQALISVAKVRQVGLAARFNPNGKANGGPSDAETTIGLNSVSFQYPIFIDPLSIEADENDDIGGRKWSLAMAARYIIAEGSYWNAVSVDSSKQVLNAATWTTLPTWQSINQILDSWVPTNGMGIDPTDPSTYTPNPIILRDVTVSGMRWPVALEHLIRQHGFSMRFTIDADKNGDPIYRLVLWKRNSGDGLRYKDVLLPDPGNDLDPATANLGSCHFARDISAVATTVDIEMGPLKHEASFILAPGWVPLPADITNKANFVKSANPNWKQHVNNYRLWVFDEDGTGHWDQTTQTWVTGVPTDLTQILGLGKQDRKKWVVRRRPGHATLFSKDPQGQHLTYLVEVAYDYVGKAPGTNLGDGLGLGTWRPIKGDLHLLKDRLGVYLNCDNPNAFSVGSMGPETGAKGTNEIRLIDWMAPLTPVYKVFLRLTCVIDGDQRVSVTAAKRPASTAKFDVVQQIDASDRYAVELISKWSIYSTNFGQAPDTFGRDDTDDAVNEAYARQSATEIAPLAGSITIPRLSLAYDIGDRIKQIRGRDISLQTNAGGAGGDPPAYPECVGRTLHLIQQSTELILSDARADHLGTN